MLYAALNRDRRSVIVLYSNSQRSTVYSTSRHGYLRLPRNCLAFQPNVGTCTVANKLSTWIFFVGKTSQEVSHSHGIYLRLPTYLQLCGSKKY